jgi:hypothetical protein
MGRNRTPQTQEKRRREHDKQRERKRNEKNAAKREAKKSGVPLPPTPVADPRNPDEIPPLPPTPAKG